MCKHAATANDMVVYCTVAAAVAHTLDAVVRSPDDLTFCYTRKVRVWLVQL